MHMRALQKVWKMELKYFGAFLEIHAYEGFSESF